MAFGDPIELNLETPEDNSLPIYTSVRGKESFRQGVPDVLIREEVFLQRAPDLVKGFLTQEYGEISQFQASEPVSLQEWKEGSSRRAIYRSHVSVYNGDKDVDVYVWSDKSEIKASFPPKRERPSWRDVLNEFRKKRQQ